ncbi:hypothetical protein FACS189463_2560 [Bacteroidia bacterium]|nr:hypothetical protein FACS189463_2560 [Bacteroidia bacterium]
MMLKIGNKKYTKKILIIFFTFAYIIVCNAQNANSTFTSRFEQLVQSMIMDNYRPFSLIREMNAENLSDSLIPLLKQYEVIPNSTVQDCIYESYFEYGMQSKNVIFKKEMIFCLLNACACVDSIELSYSCSKSINFLVMFENNLFDKEVTNIINERARRNGRYSLDYAYLSSKLYQKQMIPVFEEQLQNMKYNENKYKFNFILARLGHKQSINIVRDSLQNIYIEDRLLNEKIFLYVRQKAIVELLFNDLYSNQRETPYYEEWMEKPVDGLCANRALHLLTMLIKKFPIQQKEDISYSKDDLDIARRWVKQHKNKYDIIE